ncbi:MAG: hypothetical protein WC748_09810 [Legionellales bacterium]
MNTDKLNNLLSQIKTHCGEIESHQRVISSIIATISIMVMDEDIMQETKPDATREVADGKNEEILDPQCVICRQYVCTSDDMLYNPILNEYFHRSCMEDKIKAEPAIPMSSVTINKSDFINVIREDNPVCCTCGNIRKPTILVGESYYCKMCKQDIIAADIPEGSAVKRKYCRMCANRLPSFYAVADCEDVLCDSCNIEVMR